MFVLLKKTHNLGKVLHHRFTLSKRKFFLDHVIIHAMNNISRYFDLCYSFKKHHQLEYISQQLFPKEDIERTLHHLSMSCAGLALLYHSLCLAKTYYIPKASHGPTRSIPLFGHFLALRLTTEDQQSKAPFGSPN